MLYFNFYQLLTAFNNIKIMSEVTHGTGKRLKLFTSSIDLYLIEETAALNVSKLWVVTTGSIQISTGSIQISCEEKTTRVFIETYKER